MKWKNEGYGPCHKCDEKKPVNGFDVCETCFPIPDKDRTYVLKTEPEWTVLVTRIEMKPRFLSEPVIHVKQRNGNSFFLLGEFNSLFRPQGK